MNIKISVIIPVYNSQSYIAKCVDSVIAQTYANWECILIDDGSKDESGIICDNYASADNRIKIIHKENGGVSSARNIGIQNATGEWLTFIDSDDIVASNFFMKFIQRKECADFDLFIGDVEQISLNGDKFVEMGYPTLNANLRNCILEHKLLRTGDLHGKFFNRRIINTINLRFDAKIFYSEDRLFFDEYLGHCTNIALDSLVCYSYQRNETGLSFKLNSFESEYYCLRRLINALRVVENKTEIALEYLLHDNPAQRTFEAAVTQLSRRQFVNVYKNFSEIERFFIERGVMKSHRIGPVSCIMLKRKMYGGVYRLVNLYRNLRNMKNGI